MVKINIIYEGNLRCRLTHLPSGDEILTDAPVDNMGKGEAFSPTDLVAAAAGSCMLTIMGIVAQKHHVNLEGTQVEIIKEMVSAPMRRIGRIEIIFKMTKGIDHAKRSMLERAAETCPVMKSLHQSINIPIRYIYPD